MEKRFGAKIWIVVKWLGIPLIAILMILVFLITLSLSIGERYDYKIPEYRAISESSEGIPYYSKWVYTEEDLEEEQEKFRSMGYFELPYEERMSEAIKYEIPVADKKISVFGKRVCSTVQYRAVMEDFFGEKICSNWLDSLSEVERREKDYLMKGYFNLPREERIFTETEYTIYFFETAIPVPLGFFTFIGENLNIFSRALVFVLFILVFRIRGKFASAFENSQALEKFLKWKYVALIVTYASNLKRVIEETFLLWEPLKALLVLFVFIFSIAFLFGELMSLFEWIEKMLPYLLGAITTIIIASFAVSVVLYVSEKVRIDDMIEFEGQIGKIVNLGPIFTKIETPKNETIYIPNIMLTTKSMKRLTRKKIRGERPYIAHFSTTLSYKIPFGIAYSLFFLAIRDTVDDLENDFGKGRMRRGCECIRGLKEDIEQKIEELERDGMILQGRMRGSTGNEPDWELLKLKEKETVINDRIEELKNQLVDHRKYNPYVLIRKLDNYTVNYEFCIFTDHPFHLLKINHYLMKNLKKRFDEFGIEIMSPLQVSRREFNG